VLATPEETLRTVANRMASHSLTRLPVVSQDNTVVGVISLAALLAGRLRDVSEARDARRIIQVRVWTPGRRRTRPVVPRDISRHRHRA